VRDSRIMRVLLGLICIALVLLCAAGGPSVTHADLALPALVFCFFVVPALVRLRAADDETPAQPVCVVSIRIPRAPPVA